MSLSSTPKFRVAICDAGIGGLVLAITIGKFARRNIHIDLSEAHDAIMAAGAGIQSRDARRRLWWNSACMKKSPAFRQSPLPPVMSPGSLILHFADDSTSTTDVLVGADGVHSSVRKTLFETIDPNFVDTSKTRHCSEPSWTGTVVYHTVFPAEKLSKLDPNNVALKDFMIFCGKGKHIISYPVSQGMQINVAAYVSDEQKSGTPFEGHWDFELDAKRLLRCSENPSRWALHVVNELPLFTCDRVALIGDAAHAMTPHFGAGAGQAIEDAFVLGRLLAHLLTTLDNDVRLPFAQYVARESERTGKMYGFCAPGYYDGTDRGNEREEMEILKEKSMDQWNWEREGEGGAVAEWVKAESQLQEDSYKRRENGA
ncbi:hypothetical protein EDB19DRAFT_1903578 [Suillus lakei]|nr:hypothetical protein EDB19DRAFT_1903578 [Suillus lakei]